MGNDDFLTDDYVADLVSKDAQDFSLKYSAMGMDALASGSSKKPANAPKPNTRFLRHIIKNTDTHNKNLLAKEEAESKARLKDLERTEEVKRLKTNPNSRDIRRRQMGDIHAILGGKRPKKSRDDSSSSKPEASERRSRRPSDEESNTPNKDNDDLFSRRDRRKQHGRLAEDGERHGSHKKSSSRRSRRHSYSEDEERAERRDRRKRDKDRSRERRRRSRSPDRKAHRHRHRSPVRSKHTPPTTPADEDSDPLDDLIGPQPAPKPRGRGALAGSSGIDRRFSDTYDPTKDVDMEDERPEGGDWDDEVEAFRDRQKLKQAQEQRLRSAGFGDADIKKAEQGGERAEEDVQWSRAGEKREWDMGKQVNE